MGKIQGSYAINVDGSGIIATKSRGTILHTWFYPDSYTLSEDHTLEHIDQDLYPMNWPVTMKERLPLQKSRHDSTKIVVLEPGEKVTLLSSDNKNWVLVENSKGAKGWFAVDKGTARGTGKPAHLIFEGLCHAD